MHQESFITAVEALYVYSQLGSKGEVFTIG